MHRLVRSTLFVLVLLLTAAPLRGQDLGELIEDVGAAYAVPYLQPLADGLGADLNAGLFHTARVGGGLIPMVDIYVGAKVMGTLVRESDKSFDLTYDTEQLLDAPDGNRYRVPVTFRINDGPTVFGETEPGTVTATVNERVHPGEDGQNGTSDDVVIDTTLTFDVLPGLIDTPIAPLVVPQLGLGSIAGTDVIIRYLPRIGSDDFGTIGLTGIGVRHSVSQYIPLFPIDLTGGFMWQKLTIEDQNEEEIFRATAWAANIAASKSLLILTVYAGLQVEGSSVSVDYTFDPEDSELPAQTVAFDLTGDNNFRALAGLTFGLGPFTVNADAAVGNRTVVSAGVGLSL